jgi:hypothetical protein
MKASQLIYSHTYLYQRLLACKITYHHNFSVCEQAAGVYERSYYDQEIPKVIQVSEHRVVETKVINLWITLMLVSWWVEAMYMRAH